MYSAKPQVNLLTALLLTHDIDEAVVCPGSRNAIIVHNLMATQHFTLHSVTDERSAAFVAIGIALKTRKPVVVCVTSGSALLNTLPGVAEAAYRNLPIIVISADRPAAWIGQLDGQTLPQIGALQPYAPCWNLPKSLERSTDHWHCERLINEALLTAQQGKGRPIQINVPLSEPLFEFTVPHLPKVQAITQYQASDDSPIPTALIETIQAAQCPLLLIGQYEGKQLQAVTQIAAERKMLVFAENISNQGDNAVAKLLETGTLRPDYVIHIGGALVGKRIKQLLRQNTACTVIRIDESFNFPDTFCHLRHKIIASPEKAVHQLAKELRPNPALTALDLPQSPCLDLRSLGCEALFLANSSTVRWANDLFPHVNVPIYCNRGTNGIEGSLSVAAGYTLAKVRCRSHQTKQAHDKTLCIIGDLSFFYDANALWNADLDSSLRILLINNGGGEIFYHLPGLPDTPALPRYVAASHNFTAKGIAESYHCQYHSTQIQQLTEIHSHIKQLLSLKSDRPIIYEVFTPSARED